MIPLQETFDTVVAHLRKQNKRAIKIDSGSVESCVYLAEDGSKCAAGCLIKPEDYNESFEGCAVVSLGGQPSNVGLLLQEYGYDLKLLRALQRAHDNRKPQDWETEFQLIAKDFKLTYVPKTN